MNKLEQVARALATEDDEEFGSNAWEAYLPMARAVMEAMRGPTQAMIDAGAVEVGQVDTGLEDSPTWRTAPDAARETWDAMISAALSEKPE